MLDIWLVLAGHYLVFYWKEVAILIHYLAHPNQYQPI